MSGASVAREGVSAGDGGCGAACGGTGSETMRRRRSTTLPAGASITNDLARNRTADEHATRRSDEHPIAAIVAAAAQRDPQAGEDARIGGVLSVAGTANAK
jgi:hypothetical protein